MRSSAGRALDSKSKSRRFKSGRVQTNNLKKSYWLLQSFLQFVTRYFKRFGIKSLKIVEIICPNPKLPKLLLFFNHTPLHPPPPSGRILQYYWVISDSFSSLGEYLPGWSLCLLLFACACCLWWRGAWLIPAHHQRPMGYTQSVAVAVVESCHNPSLSCCALVRYITILLWSVKS